MINQSIKDKVKARMPEMKVLSDWMYEHPELGDEEYEIYNRLVEKLKIEGFHVEEQYLGIPTCFRAEYDSGKPGRTVAYLSEYDALPDIGHGCGHNLICVSGLTAALVTKALIHEVGGKVVLLGTPAEETNGAKVDMAEKGTFDNIDVAIMTHPGNQNFATVGSLAMLAIEFTFKGQTAHAAASPEKGINALDAVINTFNNLNAFREHMPSDGRIHGIITEGGVAANIVPDRAVAQFYVRANEKETVEYLKNRLINCAKGASLGAGTEMSINYYEKAYDNFKTNKKLTEVYYENAKAFGIEDISFERSRSGSLDAGNVSHIVPTIHSIFKLSNEELISHSREFASATLTDYAFESMEKTVCAMVKTGYDVLASEDLLNSIKL